MADHDALDDDERTDAMPKVNPAYADAEARELGERLASLYQARDTPSRDSGPAVAEEIARLRARMRKGPRLHAGEFLQDGRYRLVAREPGHQGGDEHWAAWDRRSSESVFVRVFHGEWVDDPKAMAEFRARGALLARLSHPHIGRVLEADRSDDGFVFLVTRMVGQAPLSDTRLDPIDGVQMSIELAQALAHAHDAGVVHGAVHPGNVRLDPDGHAWLAGFSVDVDARSDLASLYRAPESAERGYVPRPASDVYALGMTLLATLNGGELPFWVLRDPARLIASVPVSDAIRTVIARATDWDLGARYQDLAAFIGELVADATLVERLGSRARSKGRFGTAAEHYETLLRLLPHRAVEIRTLLGAIYTEVGAYDQAFVHLLAALERTTDVESLFDPLRTVASRTGDWARLAQALWTQARARDPGRRVVLRTELARINQQELGNAVAAAETWSQVLADHRLPAQAATALRALQELARSRSDWRGFVDYGQELLGYVTGEERSRIDYSIGRAYLEHLGDEDKGLQFIDRAEAAGYSEIDLGARLQGLRAQRGQWQRVIQLMIQQATAQDIGEASPTLLRAGIIATSVHLEDEAHHVYQSLLERAPRHVVALRHLARLHHRAHEHARALPYYERLWETYRGKESEEPEASERAADCTAYAQILLSRDEVDGAIERIDEALRLNPSHVPSLELAGPLFLARGDTVRAGHAFERLLSLFKSVELSPQKIAACLGMGELAWMQGRLTAAMGWYNRALELDPFSVAAWWGLAKVALAARAGHPGTERAPWVMAMPRRATAWEALARLFAGLLPAASMRAWLGRSSMGRVFLDDGGGEASVVRLAAAVTDVMIRADLVGPGLFRRLGDTFPDWVEPIDEVNRLVLGDGAATFPIVRTYRWVRATGRFSDFPELEPRSVMPMDVAVRSTQVEHLDDAALWHLLLGGDRPPAPVPFTMIEPAAESSAHLYPGQIGALVRDGQAWLVLDRKREVVRVGNSSSADLRLPDDPTVRAMHLRLFRQGSRIYMEAGADGRVQIDGEDRRLWRLVGGERVTIGETRLQYQQYDEPDRVPPLASGAQPAVSGPVVSGPVVSAPAEPAPVPVVSAPVPEPAPPPAPAVTPVLLAGALGESTGPIESPLAMPARSYEPQTASEPVQMPGDVIDTTPAAVDEDEPASDEELLQVVTGRAERPATGPTSDLPDHEDAPSEEGADPEVGVVGGEPEDGSEPEETERVDPAQVSLAQQVAVLAPTPEVTSPEPEGSVDEAPLAVGRDGEPDEGEPDDDEPEEATAARAEVGRYPTPVPLHRSAAPEPEEVDPEDSGGSAPSWLREALAAEARRAATVSRAPSPAPVERVTQELPPPVAPPPPLSMAERAAPKGLIPDPQGPSPLSAPPLPPPTPAVASDTGGFGFGDEFAMDDVESLQSKPRPLPSGVVGPSSVPPAAPRATPVPARPSPTPPAPPATPAPRVPLASVEFLYGPDRGRRVVVHDVLTIGSGARCGISLPNDPRLSPVHCRVEKTARGYWLRDEQSSTGTVVNGKRVTDVELKGGDVVMVGRTALKFNIEPA